MKLTISKDSHVDHIKHLSEEQRARLLELADDALDQASRTSKDLVLVASFVVPDTSRNRDIYLFCGLIGPATGFDPVPESRIRYEVRGYRAWASRMAWGYPHRKTLLGTVVAGPHGDLERCLYTLYGGPRAPKEPGDPSIQSWAELEQSRAFWAEHAIWSPN